MCLAMGDTRQPANQCNDVSQQPTDDACDNSSLGRRNSTTLQCFSGQRCTRILVNLPAIAHFDMNGPRSQVRRLFTCQSQHYYALHWAGSCHRNAYPATEIPNLVVEMHLSSARSLIRFCRPDPPDVMPSPTKARAG